MLTDPFYTGMALENEEWIPATHAPAVSKPQFARVQERLATHRRNPGKTVADKGIVHKATPPHNKKNKRHRAFNSENATSFVHF